jgi:mono/diheme cytochrome c family protein
VIRPTQSLRAAAPLLSIAVVACFPTVGCDRPLDDKSEQPSPIEVLAMRDVPRNPEAAARSRGRKVFTHYCAICHGDGGKGDGFNSTNLAVAPQDFSNADFWQRMTEERLLLAVSKGGPAVGKSVLMPAWGKTLTDRQLHDVVTYLRTLGVR